MSQVVMVCKLQLEHSRGLIQGLVLVQGHARFAVALASAACIHTSAGEMTPKGTFAYSSHQVATHHWSTPGNTSRVPELVQAHALLSCLRVARAVASPCVMCISAGLLTCMPSHMSADAWR